MDPQRDKSAPKLSRPTVRPRLAIAAMLFTCAAVYGSVVPLDYRPMNWPHAVAQYREVLRQPFTIALRSDFAANVLLFIPLGFCWLGTASYGRSRMMATLLAAPVVVSCAALSMAVEFLQFWFPSRNPSINDIYAETGGASAGCLLWLVFGPPLVQWIAALARPTTSRTRLQKALLAYCAIFAIYSLMPGDLTVSVTELYHKFRDGKVVLAPFTYDYGSFFMAAYSLLRDVAQFVPVGACAAVSLLPKGKTIHSGGRAIAQGWLFVVGIELCQLFVISRYTDTTDLVTGLMGVTIGSTLMRRCQAGPPMTTSLPAPGVAAGWWGLAALGLAIVLVLGFWYPYDFAIDAQAKRKMDDFTSALFAPMFWGSELNAISQTFLKVVPFAMLGACLGMAVAHLDASNTTHRMLLIAATLLCCATGLAIELGQILLPNHVAHITDVLLFALGSALGIAGAAWGSGLFHGTARRHADPKGTP